MILAQHGILGGSTYAVPSFYSQEGGSSGGSTYVFGYSLPPVGSLMICTIGGAQARNIVSITGAGTTTWNILNQGFNGMAWRIADGSETATATVTMSGAQTGVAIITVFKNAGDNTDFVSSSYALGTSGTSGTYSTPGPSLVFTNISHDSSSPTWTNVNNGFTYITNSGNYNHTAWKFVNFAQASADVTWSGSTNRFGDINVAVFAVEI